MAPSSSLGSAARSSASKYRHLSSPSQIRQFSTPSRFAASPSTLRPRISSSSPRTQHVLSQSRSISLFGWGSSSKPIAESAKEPGASVTGLSPSSTPDILENPRTFRQAGAPADGIDPSRLEPHLPTSYEPEAVENFQKYITEPAGELPDAKDLTQIPEYVGYMRETCGLDFGWGPSSSMQYIFESLHCTAGLSWTAAIIVLGFGFRFAIMPLQVGAARNSGKMRELTPIIKPLQDQMKEASMAGDQQKMMILREQMKIIKKDKNVSFFRILLPAFVQLPFGFGAWRMLRNAGTLPIPGFVTESWLWTTDLSFSDPYFITPAISSVLVYFTMRTNMKANAGAQNQNLMELLSKGLPPLSFAFMIWQCGAVQLYFLCSSAAGYIIAATLNQSWFRRLTNLPPTAAQLGVGTNSSPTPGTGQTINTTARTVATPPASTRAASTSAAPTPTPTRPGALRRSPQLPQILQKPPPTEASSAKSDRSAIDRGVDSLKNTFKNMKQGIDTPLSNISTEFMGSKEKREKKEERERMEREEAQFRQREREEREWRNQQRR